MQTGDHQALLPALALAGDHQHLAVPVRAVGKVLDGTPAGQVHSQIVALVAVVIAEVPIVMQRSRFLLLIEEGRLGNRDVMRFDVQGQPAVFRIVRDPLLLQAVNSGILQLEDRRELRADAGPSNLSLNMGAADVAQRNLPVGYPRLSAFSCEELGIDRNLFQSFNLGSPELVEIGGRQRGGTDQLW